MSKKHILNQIANEMLSNPNEYGLIIDDQGTQLLRGAARKMHGYDARNEPKHPTDNHKSAVLYATPDSPAKHLANGGDVLLSPRKSGGVNVDKLDPRKAIPKGAIIIKSNDIKQQQEAVKLYYDDKVLNTKEVNDIEATKCGHKLNPTGGMRWQEYQRHLEQKGDSIVTKFEYTKYADGHGQLLSKPVTVPAYYVSNVNLLPGTNDCAYFTTDSGFGRSKLINSRKQELQDKMEALILRWIEVATIREEILSLTPPNAFFYSLTKEEQAVAKGLFINALQHALEITATDPMYQNFQGILAAGGRDLQQMIQQNPHLSIAYIGQSDLAYANKAAEKLGFSPVAMVFAGDAINPVGNLVLTDKGAKAAEENQDRQSVATLEQVLNPDINKLLYDQTKYIPLSQVKNQLLNSNHYNHDSDNNYKATEATSIVCPITTNDAHSNHANNLNEFHKHFISKLEKLSKTDNESLAIRHIREHKFTKPELDILLPWLDQQIQIADDKFSGQAYHFFSNLKDVAKEKIAEVDVMAALSHNHLVATSQYGHSTKQQPKNPHHQEKISAKLFEQIVNLLINDDEIQSSHHHKIHVFNNLKQQYDFSQEQQDMLGDLLGVEQYSH